MAESIWWAIDVVGVFSYWYNSPKEDKFVMGEKIDAMGESKRNDSPGSSFVILLPHAFGHVDRSQAQFNSYV